MCKCVLCVFKCVLCVFKCVLCVSYVCLSVSYVGLSVFVYCLCHSRLHIYLLLEMRALMHVIVLI